MTVSAASDGATGAGAPAIAYQRCGSTQLAAPARTELIDIAIRAHQVGFCASRVATALEASQHERTLIDQRLSAEPGRDREELVDVAQLIGGLRDRPTARPR